MRTFIALAILLIAPFSAAAEPADADVRAFQGECTETSSADLRIERTPEGAGERVDTWYERDDARACHEDVLWAEASTEAAGTPVRVEAGQREGSADGWRYETSSTGHYEHGVEEGTYEADGATWSSDDLERRAVVSVGGASIGATSRCHAEEAYADRGGGTYRYTETNWEETYVGQGSASTEDGCETRTSLAGAPVAVVDASGCASERSGSSEYRWLGEPWTYAERWSSEGTETCRSFTGVEAGDDRAGVVGERDCTTTESGEGETVDIDYTGTSYGERSCRDFDGVRAAGLTVGLRDDWVRVDDCTDGCDTTTTHARTVLVEHETLGNHAVPLP